MMRRLLLIVASAAALPIFTAGAQETRTSLLRQATAALEDFNQSNALDLARASLDPSLGAPDSDDNPLSGDIENQNHSVTVGLIVGL